MTRPGGRALVHRTLDPRRRERRPRRHAPGGDPFDASEPVRARGTNKADLTFVEETKGRGGHFQWSPRRRLLLRAAAARRDPRRRRPRRRRGGCGATIAAGTSRPARTTIQSPPAAPPAKAPSWNTPKTTFLQIPRDAPRRRCGRRWRRSRRSSRTSYPGCR